MALYDIIGVDYNLTRRADPYIVGRLIEHLRVKPGEKYLDVACGTGNYSLAIAPGASAQIHGIDRSSGMIESARKKSDLVVWQIGDVESLPFRNDTFSGCMCILAIHHFRSLQPAFREVFRVLADGQFVIFTATPEQMRGYWLNEYFPEAMENSIRQMPGLKSVIENLKLAGFGDVYTETYQVNDKLQDSFLYCGKHRPQIYLNPRVRNGISTFASLADPSEIEEGCGKLAADMRSGRIGEVKSAYRNDGGDYLFVVARR